MTFPFKSENKIRTDFPGAHKPHAGASNLDQFTNKFFWNNLSFKQTYWHLVKHSTECEAYWDPVEKFVSFGCMLVSGNRLVVGGRCENNKEFVIHLKTKR